MSGGRLDFGFRISTLKNQARRLQVTVTAEDKIHLLTLFAVFVLGVAIRVRFLFQPIRFDEAFTYLEFATKPFKEALAQPYFPNNHPFHTLLVHIASGILGDQPWALRTPALLAGTLIIPATYMTTRIFYNKNAALLAAGLSTSSSILIEYSANARGYGLLTLIFLLIVALAFYLKKNAKLVAWSLFVILSVLGLYTIPTMLYALGVAGLWLFVSIILENTGSRRLWLIVILAISAGATTLLTYWLYLPIIKSSGLRAITANNFVRRHSWQTFTRNFPPSTLDVWHQWNRDLPLVISLLLVVGFFVALASHRRLSRNRIPIVLAVPVWIAPVLAVQRVVPFARVWLFLLPLYLGMASTGIGYLVTRVTQAKIGRYQSLLFAVLTVAISLWVGINILRTQAVYYSNEGGAYRDAEQITIFAQDYLEAGDVVISDLNLPLKYYFAKHGVPVQHLHTDHPDLNASPRVLLIWNFSQASTTLDEILMRAGLAGELYTSPELIQQFESANVYELRLR